MTSSNPFGTDHTGALLLVRDVEDVARATQTANAILARRGALGASDDVLGILVREAVDSSVPLRTYEGAGDDSVTLLESVALSRLWSLCWFDLGQAQGDAHGRRKRLLDSVLADGRADRADSTGRSVFFVVLTRAEANAEVTALVEDLEARYPALAIGRECFLLAPGGLVRQERARPSARLAEP